MDFSHSTSEQSEQASTPSRPTQSDENDSGVIQSRPNSSEGKKKRSSKKKILAERNEVSSTDCLEPSLPTKLEKTLSPGTESEKSSMSPYDPVKNCLSPRPQYLRYMPNRRQEILLPLEKEKEKEKENASADEAHGAHCWDFNSGDTPASSVASLILEDIDEQKKEECVDTDVVEEEEEDEGSSSILGGILKFFLLIVILVLSTWYMCNINSSLSKIEEACWSNLNSSSFNAETAQILNEEMSEVKNTEWPKFDKSFLFEYVSASVNSVDTAQTLHDVGVKEVQNCSSGGEDVTKTENNGEELVDLIVGGVAASEEIEDPVLELQVGEQERSSPSVNNEDSEDIEVSQTEIADAVAGLSTYKEILKGLSPQSKWVVLKAAVDFSISSLILTALLIVCKIRASNDSSLAKELKPEPVIETKREDLQVTSCTIEEEDDRRLKGSSPNPQANHSIMDDEDRMSSSSRPPSVELLGEFVVKVSSSSLKQRGVKMESGDKNHSVNIEKNHESSSERLSTSLTTRFNAAAGRTTTLKKQKVDGSDSGSGQGMKNEALLTTPVRRSSRIRNKAMQFPSPNFSSKR